MGDSPHLDYDSRAEAKLSGSLLMETRTNRKGDGLIAGRTTRLGEPEAEIQPPTRSDTETSAAKASRARKPKTPSISAPGADSAADVDSGVVARRAYEIWEQEGRPEGRETDHWYRAESEMRKQHS
jgi:hypothetical protein